MYVYKAITYIIAQYWIHILSVNVGRNVELSNTFTFQAEQLAIKYSI